MAALAAPAAAGGQHYITFGEIFPLGEGVDASAYRLQRQFTEESTRLAETFMNQVKDVVGGETGYQQLIQKVCNFWKISKETFLQMPPNRKLLNLMYYQVKLTADQTAPYHENVYHDEEGGIAPGIYYKFQAVAIPSTAELFKDPMTPANIQRVGQLLDQYRAQEEARRQEARAPAVLNCAVL